MQKVQTIFTSSGDNAACAAEFADALSKEGIKASIVDQGTQVSVFYETDDVASLQSLIMAIEDGHRPEPKAPRKPPRKLLRR